MKQIALFILFLPGSLLTLSQNRKMTAIGSSTTEGLAASTPDSSWVRRFSYYYKNQLGILDTAYNLGVSGTNLYQGMPTGYTPPPARPFPNPPFNITQAVTLLSDLPTASNGVIIINYPSGGYDTYSITEIMTALQLMYDSATRTGNRCFVTTTQLRLDGSFSTSAVKRKMADIKDSIIKRFGIAHTLNFWDGMYNPADTSFLPAYASGDNVHFNNAGHRVLFERVRAKNIFSLPPVEYRSNVSPTGLWSDPASWQVFNGAAWVPATIPPSIGSGKITILSGDSIRINSYTELDEVVIDNGAVLTIFNAATPTTFLLNDGTGPDIENNGKLYVSAGATLTGTGTIQNNSGGIFILRNQGILSVNATNNGTTNVSGTGNIQNATFTNNKTFVLIDFTLNLNNATLQNNDSLVIVFTGNSFFAGTGGVLNNAASGVIFKPNAAGTVRTNIGVTFNNNGRIKGYGEYVFITTATNNGSIAPGNSPGTLLVNPSSITGKTPAVNMEISTTGAVAGTNYDQLNFSTIDFLNTNVTGMTLNLTNTASDPVNTIYTLMTSTGTITGPFLAVNIPSNFGALTYNSNSITVQKQALVVLPLTWGKFTVTKQNNQVLLHWETLQESNTDKFVVEHSINGQAFTAIGSVAARGSSVDLSIYTFTHPSPDKRATNYYRIQQIDRDGRASYSTIRYVSIKDEKRDLVLITPNPVSDIMQISVNATDITILINDHNGRSIRTLRLQPGLHQVNVQNFLPGTYLLSVYQNKQRMEAWRLVKK